MSTEDDNVTGSGEGGEGFVPRSQIRELEKKATRATEAEQALAQAQRELAFLKAGVDTSTKAGALLLKAYEGELTVEAIKAEATELGLVQADTSGEQVTVTDEERQAAQVSNETSGTGADTPPAKDPREEAREVAQQILKQGGTRQDAVAASIAVVGQAAASGNKSVLWNPAANA